MQCTGMGVALRYAGGAPCRAVRCGTLGSVRVWYVGPKALGQAALRRRGPWAQGRVRPSACGPIGPVAYDSLAH